MISVDISNIWGEVSLPGLLAIESEVAAAHEMLMEGTGAGNTFRKYSGFYWLRNESAMIPIFVGLWALAAAVWAPGRPWNCCRGLTATWIREKEIPGLSLRGII